MTNPNNLKEDISKIISGVIELSGDGIKVAKEGVELWASIKTLNIIGIAKNGYEFLTETNTLLCETMSSFKNALPICEDIKNGIVNSQDLKDFNRELCDTKLEWNKLQDAFEKKGIFELIPELLKLFKDVGEAIDVSTKCIADLVSELGNGVVDGINNSSNINPSIKEKVDEIGQVLEEGIKIIDKGIEGVGSAQKFIENQVNILQDVGQSFNKGPSDIDKAKAEQNNRYPGKVIQV